MLSKNNTFIEENFMKKIVFYMPIVLLAILYGWLAITFGIGSISPIIFVWIALFLVGSFLLNKDKFWGGIFGILPGIHLIYMSTKDTGQNINIELPLGISILIFYILYSIFIFYKEIK